MKKTLLLLSAILVIAGCASKRYTKKAVKFEEAGLYEDAAEYYYQAVKKKDSNVEAKLGLQKTGQITLDRKLDDFMRSYKQNDYKTAVYNYLESEKYYKKVKEVNVNLDFPEHYKEYYEEAKGDYLNKKYADGIDKLNREDFDAALTVFEEIKNIDANYKDVKNLYITAKYEPMYRDANHYLENEMYRKAYYTFENIIKGAGSYKQSVALKNEAQQKGTITILISDISYSSYKFREISNKITSEVKSELSQLNNPFIKIIDPSSIDVNLYKNGELNMQAANLAGIKAVLTGVIHSAKTINGGTKKEEKKGYIKEVRKTKNSEGEEIETIRYHKTTYYEYHQNNKAELFMSYKLVSTENNSVLVSDVFNKTNADYMHYAEYKGDQSKLIPGYWKYKNRTTKEDVQDDNKNDINKLHNLLKASKKIKPAQDLLNELINQSAKNVTKTIDKYNPEQ